MNRLPLKDRVQILSLLCEGSSLRSTARVIGVSINTVYKLFEEAGAACAAYHHENVRNLKAKRVQCDEIWSFCYAKQKNIPANKRGEAGDVWTWTALDADSRLIVSYMVGGRDAGSAKEFMSDVCSRLSNRVQLSTDGHKPYLEAVEGAFGNNVDYAMIKKLYGEAPQTEPTPDLIIPGQREVVGISTDSRRITGSPDPKHISTSYVERQNLTMRMSLRRFTRKTNAFSKKIEGHYNALALYFMVYNFVRIHTTLRVTPAMQAGLTKRLMEMEEIVHMADEYAKKAKDETITHKKRLALEIS